MLRSFTRMVLASLLIGTSSLFAQGSLILGVDDWTNWGGLTQVSGPWSGVTASEVGANDDHLTADSMSVGDDYSGAIAAGGADLDYVAVTVAAGDSIRAETVDVGGLADTRLWLYDTDGVTLIGYNDNIGYPNCLSLISHVFSTAGTYYLTVGSGFAGTEGAYLMELRVGREGAGGSWAYVQKALEAVAPDHPGSGT